MEIVTISVDDMPSSNWLLLLRSQGADHWGWEVCGVAHNILTDLSKPSGYSQHTACCHTCHCRHTCTQNSKCKCRRMWIETHGQSWAEAWGVWKWCKLYAVVFTVTRSWPSRAPMGDFVPACFKQCSEWCSLPRCNKAVVAACGSSVPNYDFVVLSFNLSLELWYNVHFKFIQ